MDKKEVIEKCICGSCPSYVECKEKIGFCIARKGKSKCIEKEIGCICPACPVARKEGLRHAYYCTRGREKGMK